MNSLPSELYHFTSAQFLEDIKRLGLTKGAIPVLSRTRAFTRKTGFQWLTTSNDFDQSWCRDQRLLEFTRNDYRLQIEVPHHYKKRLTKWMDYSERNTTSNLLISTLNSTGDPENWWLYKGSIPSRFIVDIRKNPKTQTQE